MSLSFLVIDSGGLGVDIARKLGQEGHKTFYYNAWQSAYPMFEAYAPGVGIPEITKVLDYASHLDEVDCIVFPDTGMGELAHYLREKGYNVFGAGRGEELENNRGLFTDVLAKVGIKHPVTHKVNGLTEALEKLKELFGVVSETNQLATGKCFVKFDIWRGSLESFPVDSVDSAEQMFDIVRAKLGPYADSIPMVIQETVEGIETGFDVFFNGKDFVKPLMWGFENGGDYLGFITNEATFFESDLNKIAEYLRSVNYRGAFSMETIWDGRDHYWLDWTGRFPLPLGLMYPTFIQNLGELFLGIAKGEDVSSQLPLNEYIGCVALASDEASDKFVSIKGGKNTKFMRYMMDDKGNSYAVPGMSLLGISSAQGKNLEELKANLNKETDELNIFFGKFNKNAMEDIEEKYIKPLLKQGILFKEERKMSRAGLILHYLSETEDSIDSQVIKSRLQLKMSELGLSNVMVDDVVDSGDGEIEIFMSDSDGKSGSADFKYIDGKAVAVVKDIIVSLGALVSALHKESGMYVNLYELAWLDKEMMTNIVDAMGLAVGKNEPVSALKYDEFGNISGGQR